ncbi:unnamed protein product [Trichobilharzia szidati]|nr:unnamed protein product [Trichobilharzia szidati]
MTVETRNEWYNLVAESDRFVVEGNEACQENISPAQRYTVNFSKLHYDDFSLSNTTTNDFEYRDTGACFYRNSILSCGDQHQNWFGIIPGDGAVAISLVKTSVYFYSHLGKPRPQFNHLSHKSTDNLSSAVAGDTNLVSSADSPVTNGHEANLNYLPAWLVIVRREKGSDLRGCVINKTHIQNDKSLCPLIFQELNTDAFSNNNNNQDDNKSLTLAMTNSLITETTLTPNVATMSAVTTTGAIGNAQLNGKIKKPTKKLSIKMKSASAGNIPEEYSLLQYLVKNENIMEYLKPGVRDRSVYEKLLKLDEMELLNNHKFGVLLCRKDQSTEEEMYANEHSTPAFEEFLKLLGRKVRLRNYSGYTGGLDYRNDTTGSETYVTEFRDCNIVFLVSTLLPYEPNKTEQLPRKRHIGNSSVTFIFAEEGAMPFQPDTIISGFQKVFIIVRHVRLENNKFAYRVAVCREKNVPPFGPIISSDYLFEHHTSFANLLLTKAVNAAYAVLKYSKFREIMQRSRSDYLHQFCNEHIITTDSENPKQSKIQIYRRNSQEKLKQLKNSFKFRGSTFTSVDRETVPVKYNLNKANSLSQNLPAGRKNSFTSHSKVADNLQITRQRVKRNHSEVLKSTLNYNDKISEQSEENIHLSSTFHSLLDFGQSFYVGLKKWQKIDGWHSVMELFSNSLLANNEDYTMQNSIYHSQLLRNHYFETQIGISRNWLLIFTPYTISPELANKVLLAIPVVLIFAYLFEHNKKVLRIYFDCGQYVQIQDIYDSSDSNGQNTLEQLISFISYSIYPKVLQQCCQTTIKVKNTTNSFNNVENLNTYEPKVVGTINHVKLRETNSTTHHASGMKTLNATTKHWSISELGLSLSCLSPIDDHSSTKTSYSSPTSPSSLSCNPFPYILNFRKTDMNSHLCKHTNQIVLQIGSYHLPELIRILQSRNSLWCLQKLNISSPFPNLYFPLNYDLHFSTHLLALLNKLKFSANFKLILFNLPENEIFNRAQLRHHYHRHNHLKKRNHINNNINIKNEMRFSHPQLITDNYLHDDDYTDTDKCPEDYKNCINHIMSASVNLTSSASNSVLSNNLPHIIHVSNAYSTKTSLTPTASLGSWTLNGTDRSRSSLSPDVQQTFPSDLYLDSQYQEVSNLVTSKDKSSPEFSLNIDSTQNLIEAANYVQSRRRTRRPEQILTTKLNQMDLSTGNLSSKRDADFDGETKVKVTQENSQIKSDKETPISEIRDHSNQFRRNTNNKTPTSPARMSKISGTSLCTVNTDSPRYATDLSLDSSSTLDFNVTHIPVKWRRAKTEKTNSQYCTDAKIVTVRRLEATGTNAWHTKNTHPTLNRTHKVEHRSNKLKANSNNDIKCTTPSLDYIPPAKQKSRLTITKQTFIQPEDIWKPDSTKYNVTNHLSDVTQLSENELRNRLQRISKELHVEQSRRYYLANICADLLEENRKLRTGQLNAVDMRRQQTNHAIPITTTTATISAQPNESIQKNGNDADRKTMSGLIDSKIKQTSSSNPNLWNRPKLKSYKFDIETDL